jgi:hypothetical protein
MCEKYQSIVGLFISEIKNVDFLSHFFKKMFENGQFLDFLWNFLQNVYKQHIKIHNYTCLLNWI